MRVRLLIVLAASFIFLTSALFATEARMASLGYPYGFVRDETGIFIFPGTINFNNRTVVAELNNSFDESYWTIGANLPVKDFVLGLYLNKPTDIDLTATPFADMDISRKIEFLFGFGEGFGVGFAMAMDSKTDPLFDPATGDPLEKDQVQGAHYFEIKGGMSNEMMDIGVNVVIAGASDEDEAADTEESFSRMGFGLNGRYFISEDDDLAIMATLGFAMVMGGYEEPAGAESRSETVETDSTVTEMIFDLGVGVNYKLARNSTLIAGVKPIRFHTISDRFPTEVGELEATETFIYVPEYYLGLESEITDWLTGRAGARQSYAFTSEEFSIGNDSSESSGYYSDFVINLGLGFKFGDFTIDTVLKHDFLFNGPDFIGGAANGISSHISVKYTF